MSETIFIDRRKDLHRRARSIADGSVSNGLLNCRRRARDRRQLIEAEPGFNWWLHVNYTAADNSEWN